MLHIPLDKPGNLPGCPGDQPYVGRQINGLIDSQTMVLPKTTQKLLDMFQPILVFSGHDHLGCTYQHRPGCIEYTVPSIMGAYGGHVGILDLHNPSEGLTYKYRDCAFIPMTPHAAWLLVLPWLLWTVGFGILLTVRLFTNRKIKQQ